MNFRKVQALARDSVIEVLPRVPLVPFITDTDENLSAIADFMLENGVKNMQILPYNPIWLDKLPRFGSVQRLDFGEGQASSCRTRSLTAVRRFLSQRLNLHGVPADRKLTHFKG
jgi:pyruvate-formate lyase-activating enzyme